MGRQYEISGRFLGERRVFENDDGTRVIIGEVDLGNDELASIKGEAADGSLKIGLTYRFYGFEKVHPKFGPQFNFDTWVIEKPADHISVTTYLKQCKGVGFVAANDMWNKWGVDAVRMLRESPLVVAEMISRFSVEKAEAASVLLRTMERTEKTKMELMKVLHGRGLPKGTVDKIIKDYGAKSAETILANPYLLMRYRGCGFLKTDKIYLEMGHNPARLKRQTLCAWHAIASGGSGDTWYPFAVAREALKDSIAGSDMQIDRAMTLAIRGGLLDFREHLGSRWIAESSKSNSEQRVVDYLVEAIEESAEFEAMWPDAGELNVYQSQREQLQLAMQGVVGILAGTPGTGKTHCAAEVIRWLISQFGPQCVTACAPTGKAAVRLTEALQKNNIDLKATTVHTMLKVQSSGDEGWSFEYGHGNKLPFKYVVIDEWSMGDVPLTASLLAARGLGTHYLFVGDPHQLAPVGHGAPLRDMIASKQIPCGTLWEIQRNSGRVVKACAEIRERNRFSVSPALAPPLENLVVLEADTPEQQLSALESLFDRLRASKKYDPIWDVQVIVAVNDKSMLGRKPLNKKLQDLLNFDGQRVKGSPFRVGDKIICLKNSRYKSVDEFDPVGNPVEKYVANGEQGEVLEVQSNVTIVRLTAPDRTIKVLRSSKDDDKGDSDSGGSGDEEGIESESKAAKGAGCHWDLGYANTGHKCQGSSWKVVILMLDEHNGARMVQSKQYLYTGISRVEEWGVLIGKKSVADQMCTRDALFKRKTFLVERLQSAVANSSTLQRIRAEKAAEKVAAILTDQFIDELMQGVIEDDPAERGSQAECVSV